MHVHNLAIALGPAHNRRDNHELVRADEVAYAPLVLARVRVGVQVELERRAERDQAEQQEKVDEERRPRARPRAGGGGGPHRMWWRGAIGGCNCLSVGLSVDGAALCSESLSISVGCDATNLKQECRPGWTMFRVHK